VCLGGGLVGEGCRFRWARRGKEGCARQAHAEMGMEREGQGKGRKGRVGRGVSLGGGGRAAGQRGRVGVGAGPEQGPHSQAHPSSPPPGCAV
jgi:hypothetical protein